MQVGPKPIAPERSARRELSPLSAKLKIPRAVAEPPCDMCYVKMDLEKNFGGESDRSARCFAGVCRRTTGLGAFESPFNADSPNLETVEIGPAVYRIPWILQLREVLKMFLS